MCNKLFKTFILIYDLVQVSWVRLRDWHILSTDETTFTKDERFQVLHAPDQRDWTLGTPNPPASQYHSDFPRFIEYQPFHNAFQSVWLYWILVASYQICNEARWGDLRVPGKLFDIPF
jgi:hypothetical protein